LSFLSISFGGLLLHSHEYKKTNSGIELDEFHHLSYETCARCEFLKNTHYNVFFESHSTHERASVKSYSLLPDKDCFSIQQIQRVGRAPPVNLI
jgi:hypothetical protein